MDYDTMLAFDPHYYDTDEEYDEEEQELCDDYYADLETNIMQERIVATRNAMYA